MNNPNHSMRRGPAAILKALSLLLCLTGPVAAAPQDAKTERTQAQTTKPIKERRVPAIGETLYRRLQKAQTFIDSGNLGEANAILEETLSSRRLNDYERAVIWQVKSSIAYASDDIAATITAYETILQFRESIPVQQEVASLYSLAQLYFTEEKFETARGYTEEWQSLPKPPNSTAQYQFMAQLYYTLNDYGTVLTHIDALLAAAAANDTLQVKENWYQLKLSSHWEMGDFAKVKDSLEYMVQRWPNTRYWTQLAAAYRELGEVETSYSVIDAAYRQGWLDEDETQLLQMARIQMIRETPIRCAWVLEKAFAEKRATKSAQNLQTLGQCYLQAGEFEKAVKPMAAAATLEPDAAHLRQLGQLYLQLDKLEEASGAFARAAEHLDATDPKQKQRVFTLMMLRGQTFIGLGRFEEARNIFQKAKKTAVKEAQLTALNRWQGYLDAEEARNKLLTS